MSNRNLGLASPPMTPPFDTDSSYKKKSKSKKSEMAETPRQRNNKSDKYNNNRISLVSTTSSNGIGGPSFVKSATLPNLQNFVIPEELMPVGPNGEKIPIMIPDGKGGLIPFTGTKKPSKKKKKSKSSPAINQLASPTLSGIEDNKTSNSNSSSPKLPEKTRRDSTSKRSSKRHSILVPLNTTSLTPNTPQSENNTGILTSKNNEMTSISAKNLPMFIIPTGKDGKIDPSLLPTPMSSSELKERQKEYEESVIIDDDGRSLIYSPNKKGSVEKIKRRARRNSLNSLRSSVTTPANFLNNKSKSEAGEFGKVKNNKKSKSRKSILKNDNISLYSLEPNLLSGVHNRSESTPNLVNKKNGK